MVDSNKTYGLESISSTLYAQILCTKVLCAAFLYLRFGFVIFWQKKYWLKTKGGCKMLMKLTLGVLLRILYCFLNNW